MARLNLEASHQIMLFNWIRTKPELADFCFAIPNERKTSIRNGAHLKRMGLMPGASDLFIGIPKGKFHLVVCGLLKKMGCVLISTSFFYGFNAKHTLFTQNIRKFYAGEIER